MCEEFSRAFVHPAAAKAPRWSSSEVRIQNFLRPRSSRINLFISKEKKPVFLRRLGKTCKAIIPGEEVEVNFFSNHPQTVQMLTLKFKYSLPGRPAKPAALVSEETTRAPVPAGAVSGVLNPTGFRAKSRPSRGISNQVMNNSPTKRYIPCLINFSKYSNPTITASIFTLA